MQMIWLLEVLEEGFEAICFEVDNCSFMQMSWLLEVLEEGFEAICYEVDNCSFMQMIWLLEVLEEGFEAICFEVDNCHLMQMIWLLRLIVWKKVRCQINWLLYVIVWRGSGLPTLWDYCRWFDWFWTIMWRKLWGYTIFRGLSARLAYVRWLFFPKPNLLTIKALWRLQHFFL